MHGANLWCVGCAACVAVEGSIASSSRGELMFVGSSGDLGSFSADGHHDLIRILMVASLGPERLFFPS